MAVKRVHRNTRASLQKFAPQTLRNKEQLKQAASLDEKGKKAVVIAQEIKFARLLSSNDKRTRDKVLKNLRKWLTVRGQSSFAFTEADFMRLWKGLFYCMWMSDKPLIQEELAESLSRIVHCFRTKDVVLLYTTCALKTLGTEWYGIDQYRLDKFCMLTRRIIRQTFEKCKEKLWNIEWIKGISEVLEKLLVDPKICLGFNMHITELFLEELSKISAGEIPEQVVTELVKPFIAYFIPMDDERRIRHVMRHIFRYLIFQSDIGMDYMEKFKAWRDAGFPAGSIDAMERIELSDEEMDDNEMEEEEHFIKNHTKHDTEKPFDPRAGRVDVELPQIPFDAKQIATLLNQYKFHPTSTTKSRRQLRRLIKEFAELSEGKMPLGIKEIRLSKTNKKDTDTKLAALRLLQFERELYSDKLQKRRKRKKNGQLLQDENAMNEESREEGSAGNICNKNDDEDCTLEEDEDVFARKRTKVKYELDDTESTTNANLKLSNENGINLKKKKGKTKEKILSNNEISNNAKLCHSKLKKSAAVLGNGEPKKKLKANKITAAKMLDIVAPTKKIKLPKINTGKWDVSDDVNLVTPLPLNNHNAELFMETTETTVANEYVQENNPVNKQVAWLVPALKKLESEKIRTTPTLKSQHKVITGNSKKRVKIALQRNTAQHTSEYFLQIRKSPAIPFDANKKPLAGVLKASPIPSPINPFYKRNIL